ncbi:hypothetical protein E2C01_064762 [Portunus trituberculatus]|uniref:Uncharacterized protein n=1 Tax=Portunus trituberculatus TaxID=210409 RepID=A0A5B7HK12_PORTR|nr:hypothetical protein [Portunus trituberculatus]
MAIAVGGEESAGEGGVWASGSRPHEDLCTRTSWADARTALAHINKVSVSLSFLRVVQAAAFPPPRGTQPGQPRAALRERQRQGGLAPREAEGSCCRCGKEVVHFLAAPWVCEGGRYHHHHAP